MSAEEIPEPDRAEGLPHPRETQHLLGQTTAEETFLASFNSGKLPHAWLIQGPRGVGKATLAWRIAKFLLTRPQDAGDALFGAPEPPQTLDADPDHPAVRRAMALGEPRLFLLRRAWNAKDKRLTTAIGVDEVRKLKNFFTLSAADGGWRVAIVDSADEMTPSAANALLKILEEPPEKAVLLLVAHQPADLLPTIRSRCRALRCRPLGPADQAAALEAAGLPLGSETTAISELSGGSVGAAARLIEGDGVALYRTVLGCIAAAPGMDRPTIRQIAEACSGATNAARYDLTRELIQIALSRLARHGALRPSVWTEAAPEEARHFARLAATPQMARRWADLAADLAARTGHAKAVNIDPAAVILDLMLAIDRTAR